MLIFSNAIELWKRLVIYLPFLIWDDFQTVILWDRQIFSFWQEERKAKRYCDLTKVTWVGAKSPNLNSGLLLPCNQLLTSHIMFLQGHSFPLKKMTFSTISLWTCSFTDIVTSNGKRLLPECFLRHSFVLWIILGFLHSPQEGHYISYVLGFLLKLSVWIALSPHHQREHSPHFIHSHMIMSPLGSLPSFNKNWRNSNPTPTHQRFGSVNWDCNHNPFENMIQCFWVLLHFQLSILSWLS